MNKKIMLAILLGAAMTAPGYGKSYKRGVSENEFQFNAQINALAPGVSWYYNWGNTAPANLASNTSLEYVPMTWNGAYNAEKIREYVKEHPETKYLLGFNEPNFSNQANMTPQAAAEAWPAVKALADELGLKLVAPAMNYSPNPPYNNPYDWMDEFIELVGEDAFDFMAVHSYGGFGNTRDLATGFHDRYGKDIWVTEFCHWPGENPNTYVAPATQIGTMVQTVTWMEKTDFIYRYAWFKPVGTSNSPSAPNFGLLISGKGEAERELSEQGKVYVYMTDFDPEVWHGINEVVAATDYIDANNISLGAGNNPQCPKPIEISQFNAGANVDYQFDIPAAGEYSLVLNVSGIGEPERFDPNISICLVDDEGNAGQEIVPSTRFSLPGSDEVYWKQLYHVELPAGKQTIRIQDMAPYTPSGVRISTIAIFDEQGLDADGVDETLAGETDRLVDVYTMTGVLLKKSVESADALNGLPAGMYLVGGKIVIKK